MKNNYSLMFLLILVLIFSTVPGITQPFKMYVVNQIGHTISQANLDGSGGVSLGNLNGTLNWPHHLILRSMSSVLQALLLLMAAQMMWVPMQSVL